MNSAQQVTQQGAESRVKSSKSKRSARKEITTQYQSSNTNVGFWHIIGGQASHTGLPDSAYGSPAPGW